MGPGRSPAFTQSCPNQQLPALGSLTKGRVPHSPGFPVKFVGVDELHAAFLNESRTRGCCWCRVQEIRVSRSFFARCERPPLSPSDSRFIRCTYSKPLSSWSECAIPAAAVR